MHGRSRTPRAIPTPSTSDGRARTLRRSGAVTWVDGRHALIAHTTTTGADVVEVQPPNGDCLCPEYLSRVVDEIGDRERVLVLGPEAFRVMLEREYVAISGRPDRILEAAGSAEVPAPELLARLDALTRN